MAKFLCPCEEELSDSKDENIRLHAWSHSGWEKLSDDIQNAISFKPRISSFFAKSEFDIWHCPKCERLHFFGIEGNFLKTYAIESAVEDD